MQKCHLAVDIGASSGRVMAGYIQKDRLNLVEIYRFDNQMIEKNGHLCWDIDYLFQSIKRGIKTAIKHEYQPTSLAIDTWAVDFVLLDEHDRLLTDAVAYRDDRTDGVMEEVFQIVNKEEIYERTGIQFQPFNTIYQLKALQNEQPEVLAQAKTFLMIPDYLNFLLTGKKVNEYTNATSTQLIHLETNNWDHALIEKLGFPKEIFQTIQLPKHSLGPVKSSLVEEFGVAFDVILSATHDTASAVIAVPEQKETIYLSSGTWSLMGIENKQAIATEQALAYNFTNEGGVDYRYRFLKNIMGLWMIQEVKRLYQNQYGFSDFVKLAREAESFHSIIDVNDSRFLKPNHMIEAIKDYCREKSQPVPETPGEIAQTIFISLAKSYQQTVVEIEDLTGKEYNHINIIGGGCQNERLNQLLADYSGKIVQAGPVEATALGNIVIQLLESNQLTHLAEARQLIRDSFPIKTFYPRRN
ncbi:rhamnulokinase [Amphibacillus sp. MSJ-3]|uniref:rhamnulokinase n=1 Tax=Amphibacillus sp. MSJ-3 TaxID=2841505 RepID=UPI001C0F1B15|nr:rhamnulokinase [Amphibacillus sp. MSJ-3]MBU5594713.1 rhamnulokinase [Amphibacillus sp. MSJ-3]